LPPRLQEQILRHIKLLHHALRECGRSDREELRLAAMKLIALARQGKQAYVLSENLHDSEDAVSAAAAEAMVELAAWVAGAIRKLQDEYPAADGRGGPVPPEAAGEAFAALYREVMDQRPEIELAVTRALDVHRGTQVQELARAAMLLCDWPGSKTLTILRTARHGGQSVLVRRLQQVPAADQVEAFLLGATHGQLRAHFGTIVSHISEPAVLDAILRKTHWLKDHQLQLCMHQVTRGVWWQQPDLMRDVERRPPAQACQIGEWLAASGMHDLMQDQWLIELMDRARQDFSSRLRLLRIVMRRKRGTSVQFLRQMLNDPDERLMRMAAREMIRHRPPDADNILLQLMTNAPLSVRRVISRSIGQAGFEQFWIRFDRLDGPTRKQAGRAMLKLLPDGVQRLSRRLSAGPIEQRLKAMQITQELGLAESLRDALTALTTDPNPKIRSKAIMVLGELESQATEEVLERGLNDPDSRVRANTIEALEARPVPQFAPLLTQLARDSHHRERANAIRALHRMKSGNVGPQLIEMLHDDRPEHRISAMWALRQIGWWQLLEEVGRLAKEDTNLRVRRYAVGVLKRVAEMMQTQKEKAG